MFRLHGVFGLFSSTAGGYAGQPTHALIQGPDLRQSSCLAHYGWHSQSLDNPFRCLKCFALSYYVHIGVGGRVSSSQQTDLWPCHFPKNCVLQLRNYSSIKCNSSATGYWLTEIEEEKNWSVSLERAITGYLIPVLDIPTRNTTDKLIGSVLAV